MRPSIYLPAMIFATTVVTGAHAAGGHPPLMPTQDATVTYNVQPDGQPARVVTVHFGGDGQKLRIDFPSGPQGSQQGSQGFAAIDRVRHSVIVVMNPQRSYMELGDRDDRRNPFLLDATMSFTRTGTSSVAGQNCTTWAITDGKSANTTACITDSGIILSEKGADSEGRTGQLEATAVSLAPVPAADFEAPAGYTRVAHNVPSPGPAATAPSGLPPLQTGPVTR